MNFRVWILDYVINKRAMFSCQIETLLVTFLSFLSMIFKSFLSSEGCQHFVFICNYVAVDNKRL